MKIKASLLVCALALALVLGTFGCGGGQRLLIRSGLRPELPNRRLTSSGRT